MSDTVLVELFWAIGHVGFGCLAFVLMYKLSSVTIKECTKAIIEIHETLIEIRVTLQSIVNYLGVTRKDN